MSKMSNGKSKSSGTKKKQSNGCVVPTLLPLGIDFATVLASECPAVPPGARRCLCGCSLSLGRRARFVSEYRRLHMNIYTRHPRDPVCGPITVFPREKAGLVAQCPASEPASNPQGARSLDDALVHPIEGAGARTADAIMLILCHSATVCELGKGLSFSDALRQPPKG
ncbi:hypothetical protein NDU88_005038 [Pleurodeles waltl]|uniref:Uncharacterized protein n=1 Tax=Pleurodeles waltl TaxID=8319 RepID=A0AAV7M831_PLEWA|nr:hypothetical protein NDU88_005038 [Pleurodeles waltl]